MSKKRKRDEVDIGKRLINEIWDMGLILYLFAVLLVLPLYTYDHYWEMAWHKWKVYLNSTCSFLIFAVVMMIVGYIYSVCKKKKVYLSRETQTNNADRMVAVYGILLMISFVTCPNRMAAWMGAEGWFMGVVPQLLIIVSYFIFSKRDSSVAALLILHGAASAFCYFYAICQRLGNDWMHLYYVMPDEVKRDYLSTIGNRTWFSAYICTAFPIGVFLFWYAGKMWIRCIAGVYTFLAFMCMVMVNSDSIYAGLLVVCYIIGILSIGDEKKRKRFLEICMIWFVACILMFILRETIPDFPREIRGLSRVFMDLRVSITGFLLVFVIWLVISMMDGSIQSKRFTFKPRPVKVLSATAVKRRQVVALGGTGIVVVLVFMFIALNSTGIIEKLVGRTVENQYLLFDDRWGDDRGHTWKMTLTMFKDLPLTQKLFGVGADCFGYAAYSNPQYAKVLNDFWGEQVIVNAHNEWLNSILCLGILGGLAYIGIFLIVVYECIWKIDLEKCHPIIPAIGLCVMAYMAHNFFCYQQVCATPVIFILMGMAIHLKKRDMCIGS